MTRSLMLLALLGGCAAPNLETAMLDCAPPLAELSQEIVVECLTTRHRVSRLVALELAAAAVLERSLYFTAGMERRQLWHARAQHFRRVQELLGRAQDSAIVQRWLDADVSLMAAADSIEKAVR